MPETWYRISDCRVSCGNDETGYYSRPDVSLSSYPVLRTTPYGVWLDLGFNQKRWVNYSSRKRWACPTREAALESFLARKRRHRGILEEQMRHVDTVVEMAQLMIG